MIINHNMNAMTAHRQMGINTGNQGKAIEKLSSGQRINRAGDDAAGLAISEKMRGQIRGLDGASRNAQDGVSLIQTAEGALNETHNILQRMRELAVQGANDTNVTEDRDAIQKEMNALMEEIDRISTDTEFNGQKLLDGEFTDKKLQIGANTNQKVDVNIDKMNSDSLLEGGLKGTTTITNTVKTGSDELIGDLGLVKDAEYTISKDSSGTLSIVNKDGSAVTGVTIDKGPDEGSIKLSKAGKNVIIEQSQLGELKEGQNITIKVTDEDSFTTEKEIAVRNEDITAISWNGTDLNIKTTDDKTGTDFKAVYEEGNLKGFTGTNAADKDKFYSAEDLGLKHEDLSKNFSVKVEADKKVKSVDVSTHDKATNSIKTIDKAIEKVSTQRADLGAMQNRLEHTIATNNNSAENLQAAESRIRDVDMAKEMMNLSKNNVLVQAAQSMLGQANQQPNQVLSLLR